MVAARVADHGVDPVGIGGGATVDGRGGPSTDHLLLSIPVGAFTVSRCPSGGREMGT